MTIFVMQREHLAIVKAQHCYRLVKARVGFSSEASSAYCSMDSVSDMQVWMPLVAIGRTAEQPDELRSDLPGAPAARPCPRRLGTDLSVRTVNEMVRALQAPCDVVLPRCERHVRPTAAE